MAAGYMQHLSQGKVKVLSAGSAPKESINPIAIQAMAEEGIDIANNQPKVLTNEAVQDSDVVITMGCGDECPLVLAERRVDWKIPDPRDMTPDQFRGVRDLIESKVKELIGELSTA